MKKNYIQTVREDLAKESKCKGVLLDLYTLLVFSKGEDCTLDDVHDAWAVWKNQIMPYHRSLIPFKDLSFEVQELDRDYMDAIRKVAERHGL